MIPTIALVGQPNVGKSTLFNYLTKTRDALVMDTPGLTRDRQYGHALASGYTFIVIDTGGIGTETADIDQAMSKQSQLAMEEADIVLFMVDAQLGATPVDQKLADTMRRLSKPVYLIVNKTDGYDPAIITGDFYQLGLGEPIPIAAHQGRGVSAMLHTIFIDHGTLAEENEQNKLPDEKSARVAIIGRPNVGKSTLVNRVLGEERVVVFDQPGTTRSSIFIPMERQGKHYILIDTAGVRKKGRVKDTIEKFSIVKTLQAIEVANVVVLVLDAQQGLSTQDMHLLGYALDAGRGIVIAVNKWDGMEASERDWIKNELKRRLHFADYLRIHFISALHGTAVGDLFPSIDEAYHASMTDLSTSALNRLLAQAVEAHQPPAVGGRYIKLRYAHSGGKNPPCVVLHGNKTEYLPHSYQRYLIARIRKQFNLMGTPIKLVLRSGDNPFDEK